MPLQLNPGPRVVLPRADAELPLVNAAQMRKSVPALWMGLRPFLKGMGSTAGGARKMAGGQRDENTRPPRGGALPLRAQVVFVDHQRPGHPRHISVPAHKCLPRTPTEHPTFSRPPPEREGA